MNLLFNLLYFNHDHPFYNMKIIKIIPLLISILSCGGHKGNSGLLDGSWVPVKQEIGGRVLPENAYKDTKLIISDTIYTMQAENLDRGVVKYSGNRMDIFVKEGVNTGKHFTAIFKYDSGRLTICYNLLGSEYPPAFETNGKPLYFLSEFLKESGE